ncbi:MAG: helix-turn-helix domain-containing protein [Verrucomicrobia bacterium]|nr:helix-turn-helix domain-containing protein [Verrucomicrobiota bacterium]
MNSSNVLDMVGRSMAEGVFETAERKNCPYMIEIRHEFIDHNLCAGLIGMLWKPELVHNAKKYHIPVVNLSNTHGPLPGAGNVLSDDDKVGHLAARHLLSRGYRHFLGLGVKNAQYSRERLTGFRDSLKENGFECQTLDLETMLDTASWSPQRYQEHIWEQAKSVIFDLPLDTGLFVVSDWLAWPVLRSVEKHTPQRLQTLGILGVDNLHGGRFDPRKAIHLSSIQPGFKESGRLALALMMDHVFDGKELEIVLRSPPETLIERASTAGPACADPILAKILRAIWVGIRQQEAVTLGDLARSHGMSSSTFEKKFRATLGKPARDMVTEMRIDYAKELLRLKQHPIGEICYLCGYANPASFSNAFKAVTGLSPRDWQRRSSQ